MLFDPKNWPKDLRKQPKGLEVLENCLKATEMSSLTLPDASLVKHSKQADSQVLGKKQRTPRKKNPPSKLQQYVVVTAPSGICPKCQIYVKEGGVACEKCQAFWHYACVGVCEEELEENWNGKPFLCPEHRGNSLEAPDVNNGEVKLLVKVHSYSLNPETAVKKLLSSLDIKPKIEPRDDHQQYYVRMSPPSYELLVANLSEFGNQWGISIKGGGVDNQGTRVNTQFLMELTTESGLQVVISANCHSTNSSVHLQLNKKTKEEGGWEDKKACFSHFVTHTLDSALKQVEMTDEFLSLKEKMKADLEQSRMEMIAGKEEGPQPLTTANLLSAHTGQCTSLEQLRPVLDDTLEVAPSPPSPSKLNRKKTSELAGRIQVLEKEKIGLSQTVKTLTAHQETLRSTIESKSELLATQTKLVSDQQEKIRKQEQQIDELKISSESHNQIAGSFLNCLVAAEEGNEVISRENEVNVKQQLYKNLSDKDDQIAALSKEKAQLQAEVQKLEASLGEKSVIEEKYNEAMKKLQVKNKEHSALVTQMSASESAVVSRKKELDAAATKLADAENVNNSIRHELDKLRKTLSESESSNEKIKEELDQLKRSSENPELHQMYKQLCTQVQLKDEEIVNLQESNAYSEKSIDELKVQLVEKENMVGFIQEQVKEESSMRLKYQEQLCESQVENKNLKKNVAALSSQLERNRSMSVLQELPGEERAKLCEQPQSTVAVDKQDGTSVPCIFELKEKGRCNRGEKCKFNHNFDPVLRGDMEAIKKLLDDTSNSINRCAIEMVDGKCPDMENCPYIHKSQKYVSTEPKVRRVCFRELMEEHSCKRKNGKCKFSHVISKEQRNDPSFVDQMIKVKEAKASKCINEFEGVTKCRRGLKCPFSHTISDEDRKNTELRRRVAETKNNILGKSDDVRSLKSVSVENEDLKSILLSLVADVKALKENQSCP